MNHLKNIRHLSEATMLAYKQDLAAWVAFLVERNSTLVMAEKSDARSFLMQMSKNGMASSTVNRRLSALKNYHSWCLRHGSGKENPFQGIHSVKQGQRLPGYLTYEEIETLIDSTGDDFVGTRDRVLLELLYSTGCRIGEICSLNIDDIRSREVRVRGKGGKERFVFIGRKAAEALEVYLSMHSMHASPINDSDEPSALLLNGKGLRLTARAVRHRLHRYAKMTGMAKPVHPHAFRHSFATHMYDEGANIRTVQELLGHSSLSTTQIYTHTGIERIKRVYRNSHPHGRRND